MLLDVKISAVKTGELERGGRLSGGGVGRRRLSPGDPPRRRSMLAFARFSSCFSSAVKKQETAELSAAPLSASTCRCRRQVGQCQEPFNPREERGRSLQEPLSAGLHPVL